jgi:UDP-glucose 4-epimerase
MAGQAHTDAEPAFEPLRQGELLRSCLDPSRAGIQLGWAPWTELDAGTAAVLDFVGRRLADGGG